MAKGKNNNNPDPRTGTEKRLDAIIWLLLEVYKKNSDKKVNEGDIARLLKSMDLTPTEIAKIMCKKSASDISVHLYAKKKVDK